ncbi:MAG: ComF family protein [Nitrospinae bacterium]|nr:ComF family protein [Nitrospinota bacterium]
MGYLRRLIGAATDLLIPPKCLLCSASMEIGDSHAICVPCTDAFERFAPPWCPRCGNPFHSLTTLAHSPAHVCADCLENGHHYDMARAIGAYEGSLRESVQLFKFQGFTKLAGEFAPLLARLAAEEFEIAEDAGNVMVTHVPIDPARWRTRGFDQAMLLALRTAAHLGLPHADLLERAKATRSQTGLSARERRRNMRGVFRVRSRGMRQTLESATCILVDDVVTTGSTASACARELKKAGAEAVHLLTICRS